MAYKYRCPYCGEKGLLFVERCGIGVISRTPFVDEAGFFRCRECRRTPDLLYGKSGAAIGFLISCVIPVGVGFYLAYLAFIRKMLEAAVYGVPALLLSVCLFNLLFAHFDKSWKVEREADARLTLTVSGKYPFVKKWGVYLVRFPKRGTNEHSPVLYGMMCGKSGKKGKRTYTLRVICTDNMDLPDLGEPAWLITDSNKVVEGTVTAVTPRKPLPEE